MNLLRLADLFHDHDALSAVAQASKHGDSSGEEGTGEEGVGAGAGEGAAGDNAMKYAKQAARPVLDMLPRVPPMLVVTLLRMLQARSHFISALGRPLPFPLFVACVVECRAVPRAMTRDCDAMLVAVTREARKRALRKKWCWHVLVAIMAWSSSASELLSSEHQYVLVYGIPSHRS